MSSTKNTRKEVTRRPGGYRKGASWRDMDFPPTKEEYYSRMKEDFPRDLILNFNSVRAVAERHYHHFKDSDQYKSPPIACHCSENPSLSDWVQNELRSNRPGHRKCLVLYGESRLGKTIWARSLGRHAYFGGLFMLEGFDESVQYAIWDNMDRGFKSVPQWKSWFGCAKEIFIADKYVKKRRIEWDKVSIYLSNEDPRSAMKKEDVAWLEQHCVFVEAEHYVAHVLDGEGRPAIDSGMPPCRYCSHDSLGVDTPCTTRKRKIADLDSDDAEHETGERQRKI